MEKFLELLFAGLALGARYALVALGFVVIFRATGVINFAQGGFVALGAYLAYTAINTWEWPFALSVVTAMLLMAVIGALIYVSILRWLVGRPVLTLIMVTIGILIALQQVTFQIWGPRLLPLGDPWGLDTVEFLGVPVRVTNIWTMVLTAIAVAILFAYFRYTRMGVAMRATALDQEAALAQGISVRRVSALSWAIAGALAALAGVMIAAEGSGVTPTIEFVALAAFPAIILGGLESPGGAVIGGVVIGVAQQLTGGYQPDFLPVGLSILVPYLVMGVVLLVRPYGLFGEPEVERV